MHIDYGSFASLSGGDIGMLAAQYQPKFFYVLFWLFILDIKRWCILLIDPLPVLSGGDSGMLAAQYQPLTGQLLAILRRELCRKIN